MQRENCTGAGGKVAATARPTLGFFLNDENVHKKAVPSKDRNE